MNFDEHYAEFYAQNAGLPERRRKDLSFCEAAHEVYVETFGPFTKENPYNLACVCGAHLDRPQLKMYSLDAVQAAVGRVQEKL